MKFGSVFLGIFRGGLGYLPRCGDPDCRSEKPSPHRGINLRFLRQNLFPGKERKARNSICFALLAKAL